MSGIRHTSPKTHLKSLVVRLGDTKLQKEKSFMLKNLDLLASLIAEKIKSLAQFARTCRLIERIWFDTQQKSYFRSSLLRRGSLRVWEGEGGTMGRGKWRLEVSLLSFPFPSFPARWRFSLSPVLPPRNLYQRSTKEASAILTCTLITAMRNDLQFCFVDI